jgi:glycosyltransferase involved in cell wall biosynthesis
MRAPVLHVAPALWSGAGSVITRLAEHQRASGPVVVVTSDRNGIDRDWPEYRRRLRRAGISHRRLDFLRRDAHILCASTMRLARLIDELEPGVIHAHAGGPSLGAVLARASSHSSPRLIAQMYSWGPGRPEWMNVQDTCALAEADRVICSAYAYRDLLIDYGVPRSRLVYLPWGLPLERLPWRGPARVSRPNEDGPRIGFVGRIEPRKGQLGLVQALSLVRRRHPSATLTLVGPIADTSYAAAIRACIASEGLEDAVCLAGQVADVPPHVRTWDLFVSLSEDEGQGLAVLEAMALGVPVVTRLVAGVSDFVVPGRTGIVLASAAPRTVARTIADAVADASAMRRISRRARIMVERRYAWERTTAAFDALYWTGRT